MKTRLLSSRREPDWEPAGLWYDVSAFSDEPGFFAVSFREVTTCKWPNEQLMGLSTTLTMTRFYTVEKGIR